jgi:DNA-binding IclR family transcriptional regulator
VAKSLELKPAPEGPQRNATAQRAIDILLLFDESAPVLSASQVASALKMSRSTTYRYLQSLRSCELLEEDELRSGFRLGPRVFRLARVARIGLGLPELALPVMRELAEETDEAVLLTKRAGNQVICIERVDSSHPVRLAYERGHVLPIHAGASAKVLLASSSEDEIEEALEGVTLARFTERTATDPKVLRRQLRNIRKTGYAVSDGEVDSGVRGIAAPIWSGDGRVLAGLSVAGPSFRLTDAVLPKVISAVRRAADAITARVGEVQG